MKKEIADKWVVALRSGKYQQATKTLRNSEQSFCCLGVLCDISGIGTWKDNVSNYRYVPFDKAEDWQSSFLPYRVQDWAGMARRDGTRTNGEPALSYLNDQGKTFEEIAEIIENEWETL